MIIKYLKSFEEEYSSFGVCEGLTEYEIQELEKRLNSQFPSAYREFLFLFGRKTGTFLSSYLMSSDYFERNKNAALIASFDEVENIRVTLKSSYFFFAQWQGYNFYFFDFSELNPDPKIYLLTDTPEIMSYKDSFTSFLIEEGKY